MDEQALLELKREQLLQQYSGMGPVPGTTGPGGTGDRNQWYSMNLAGGSTFGAGPLEQPPPLPPQAGQPPQAPAPAAEQPPQVLRPKPLPASAALSGGTPQYAGQEQPVTSRSPLAGRQGAGAATVVLLYAGGCCPVVSSAGWPGAGLLACRACSLPCQTSHSSHTHMGVSVVSLPCSAASFLSPDSRTN